MQEAISILRHSESVLAKKIKGMKDGIPKYNANEKISEIRDSIKVLQDYEKFMQTVPDGWSNAWPTMPVGH
jgi:hypothetical protein